MEFHPSNGSAKPSYKAKLRQMQKLVKRYVILNAALCDQVSETQEQLVIAKENRKFLFERLQRLSSAQQESASQATAKPISLNLGNIYPSSSQGSSLSMQEDEDLVPMPLPLALPLAISLPLPLPTPPTTIQPTTAPKPALPKPAIPNNSVYSRRDRKKKILNIPNTLNVPELPMPIPMGGSIAMTFAKMLVLKRPELDPKNSMRSSKCSELYDPSVAPYSPFPMTLRGLTVHSVGTPKDYIVKETNNGLETLIPVDFHSERIYGSVSDPETRCRYECRVYGPHAQTSTFCQRFEISSSELDAPIGGQTADACHGALLRRINNAMGAQVTTQAPKGEWFFGYALPEVKRHIDTSVTIRTLDSRGRMVDEDNDDTLNFEDLQRSIAMARYEAQNLESLTQEDGNSSPQHWEV